MEIEEGKVLAFQGRGKGAKSPDWVGWFTLDGQRHQITLWQRTSEKGNEYLSGKIGSPESEHYGWKEDKEKEDKVYSPALGKVVRRGTYDKLCID